MSVFSKLYVVINNMRDNEKFVRWNAAVYDEILFAFLVLPFAEADVRAPVSRVISATDATVERAGSCTAQVPPRLADMLFSRAENEANMLDSIGTNPNLFGNLATSRPLQKTWTAWFELCLGKQPAAIASLKLLILTSKTASSVQLNRV